MSHELSEMDYLYWYKEARQLKRQIKLLYVELGWSEETIRKWERGELDVR